MKIQYKIALLLLTVTGLFYLFLPKKNTKLKLHPSEIVENSYVELKIYTSQKYFPYYNFKLTDGINSKQMYFNLDTLKKRYYLTSYNISSGPFQFQVNSMFDSAIKFNFNIKQDTSFQLDSGLIKTYDKSEGYYSYFKNRIKENQPFNLVFESRGCFSGSNVRYAIHSNPNKPSMIYQVKDGIVCDSMNVDIAKLNKKLNRIMRYYKYPEKPKSFVNELGETIITIEHGFSTSSTTLYFNHNEKIYSIWSNEMIGKGYEYFESFCASFENPVLQMKI